MRTWIFNDVAKLTFQRKFPSQILIGARSFEEAKRKLAEYIAIGVKLGYYVDPRS